MLRVVGEVLARFRVREDRQPVAVQSEELRNVAKGVARHRQLDAPARMRADRPQMEMADSDREARLNRGGEPLRALDLTIFG